MTDTALATVEELNLLVQVYVATGNAQEAMTLFPIPHYSQQSGICHHNPKIWLSMFLFALENRTRSEYAFDACKKLLESAKHASNESVW